MASNSKYNYERYGFTQVDSRVQSMTHKIIALLLKNMVTNALYITNACSCKTLKASHFEAVQNILKHYLNKKGKKAKQVSNANQKGGFTVIAGEYFTGIQSGAYFDEVDYHSPIEAPGGETRAGLESTFHTTEIMAGGSRDALNATFPGPMGLAGGAVTTGFVTSSMVKKMLKDMKLPVRVAKDAVEIIVASINSTMDTIFQKARIAAKDKSQLTFAHFAKAARRIKHVRNAIPSHLKK